MRLIALVTLALLAGTALPAEPASLVGSWSFIQDGVEHKLILSKDGKCLLSSKPKNEKKGVEEGGKYVVEEKKLTITLKDKTVDFTYSLRGDRLTLKGGKFGDEGVVFKKDESVDFRKLVGNWECAIAGDVTKTIRFRADGSYSALNLRRTVKDLDKTRQTEGRYSIQEDNTLKMTEADNPLATVLFRIRLQDELMTLHYTRWLGEEGETNAELLFGVFPPEGCTFVRKKEVTEIKAAPAENLPGSAAWDLEGLKVHFRILKTSYDKETRQVSWILETREAIRTRPPALWFRFYDADDVRLDSVKLEYRPADAVFAKGEKLRGLLTVPAQIVADMKKVIASEKP